MVRGGRTTKGGISKRVGSRTPPQSPKRLGRSAANYEAPARATWRADDDEVTNVVDVVVVNSVKTLSKALDYWGLVMSMVDEFSEPGEGFVLVSEALGECGVGISITGETIVLDDGEVSYFLIGGKLGQKLEVR